MGYKGNGPQLESRLFGMKSVLLKVLYISSPVTRIAPLEDLIIKYIDIILPFAPYGCKILSLILSEECRLKVFENRNLRRISGPNRDEIGVWIKLDNEELYSL